MRFRKPFKHPTIFTEMFQPLDWTIFNHAYKRHEDSNKLDRRLDGDRVWVEDVILSWSEKLGIPLSLAVMVFETGDYHATQRHYKRLLVKSDAEGTSIRQSKMDDAHKAFAMEAWQKKHKDIMLVCEWDASDLANWCRHAFVHALTISHPRVRFDAHAKRDDRAPKPRNEERAKSKDGVKTESRTPRAKSKKKLVAEQAA